MLAISVELLHGTIRATGATDDALTGTSHAGEWPPSPARLFSALVAADGTGARRRVTTGDELRLLERARPPRIVADGLGNVLVSPLRERFVIGDKLHVDNKTRQTLAVHEYVGRSPELVRPGVRLAPASPTVVYVWDDLDVDADMKHWLALRAARVAYLGCSDSPARVRVSTEPVDIAEAWTPHEEGQVLLPVPYEGFLDELDEAFRRASEGVAFRRAWIPNRYARYRPPGRQPAPSTGPTVVWLRFEPAVSGRRLLAVTESLRDTVLDRYGDGVGGTDDDVPSVLHGHGFGGSGYHQAYFLALPDVGHRHARGRLHGGAVVLPPGTPPEVIEGVRAALWRVTTLARPGVFRTSVRPYGGEARPVAATPSRWLGPARHWVSATPVMHERHHRDGPDLEEVRRWCEHAGVRQRPVWFRISRVPLVRGGLSLHPSEVYREGKQRGPYSHLEVIFEEPVSGPLVLGRARQFGFGLMVPLRQPGGRSNG